MISVTTVGGRITTSIIKRHSTQFVTAGLDLDGEIQQGSLALTVGSLVQESELELILYWNGQLGWTPVAGNMSRRSATMTSDPSHT